MADLLVKLKAAGVDPCDDGTHNHQWLYINPPCETCGDHDGLMCATPAAKSCTSQTTRRYMRQSSSTTASRKRLEGLFLPSGLIVSAYPSRS